MDVWQFVAFLALGVYVGFLAGLLGIGGGLTVVPVLTALFAGKGFPPEHVVHMAVATATASVFFTTLSSAVEHQRHGAIVWRVVFGMVPGIVLGALIGPQIVAGMSSAIAARFFGLFVIVAATQILLDRKPKATREIPGRAGLSAAGAGIGLISSMVGAGGAFLTVPFMTAWNVDIRRCVATSAAVAVPVAATGTIGFVIAGLQQTGMPSLTLGYLYLPALVAIVAASVVVAPFGARAAHRWPTTILKRVFVVMLYGLAAYMLWKSFQLR